MRGGSKGLTVLKRENWSRVAVTCDQAGFIILRHGREGITVHKWSYTQCGLAHILSILVKNSNFIYIIVSP